MSRSCSDDLDRSAQTYLPGARDPIQKFGFEMAKSPSGIRKLTLHRRDLFNHHTLILLVDKPKRHVCEFL